MKQESNTQKPEWLKEQYPENASYTEINSGDEADVFMISYHNGDYSYHYDIVRRNIWEGGIYSIKKNII